MNQSQAPTVYHKKTTHRQSAVSWAAESDSIPTLSLLLALSIILCRKLWYLSSSLGLFNKRLFIPGESRALWKSEGAGWWWVTAEGSRTQALTVESLSLWKLRLILGVCVRETDRKRLTASASLLQCRHTMCTWFDWGSHLKTPVLMLIKKCACECVVCAYPNQWTHVSLSAESLAGDFVYLISIKLLPDMNIWPRIWKTKQFSCSINSKQRSKDCGETPDEEETKQICQICACPYGCNNMSFLPTLHQKGNTSEWLSTHGLNYNPVEFHKK